jgi:hypothetical protein
MKHTFNFCTAALSLLGASLAFNSFAAGPDDVTSKLAARATAPGVTVLALRSVGTAFQAGDAIGAVQSGAQCATETAREWSALIRQRVESDLAEVFSTEMSQIKTAAGSTAGLLKGAEINAFVNDLNVQVCKQAAGAWRGEFNVQVSWQVMSAETGRMIYQASTSGTYVRDASQTAVSAGSSLRQALTVAVRNLTTDRRFATLLRAPEDKAISVASAQ